MRTRLLKGEKFTVYACEDENGKCPVNDFLLDLLKAGNTEGDLLTRRLQALADGIQLRKEAAHPLENGFFVVKTSGMTRLIWFYDPTEKGIMICTHCFRKPAGEKYASEQKIADGIREKYKASRSEKALNAPKIEPLKSFSKQNPKRKK